MFMHFRIIVINCYLQLIDMTSQNYCAIAAILDMLTYNCYVLSDMVYMYLWYVPMRVVNDCDCALAHAIIFNPNIIFFFL